MIGNPLHHQAQKAHHIWRGLLVALIALLAYFLVSNTAEAGPFPPVIDLGSLDGTDGFAISGIRNNGDAGSSVSDAGDINGDGIADVIIGAPAADPAGESYVIFGRATGFPPTFELRDLLPGMGGDGSQGFVLQGVGSADGSGQRVSAVGDVNNDGIDDLIVGAPDARHQEKDGVGESYVVFGRFTPFPPVIELSSFYPRAGGDGSLGFVIRGIDTWDTAGYVSGAGDINDDGIGDLIIGASGADPNGLQEAGESYVVFGRQEGFPPVFPLRRLYPAAGGDGSKGFVLKGVGENDRSGFAVSGAGDVDGDGVHDLIIGAYWANTGGLPQAGESYVVFGRSSGFPPVLELRSLFPQAGGDGTSGFVLSGIRIDDQSGRSVSDLGDLNADGVDDIAIGARAAAPGGMWLTGEAYVVFGRATGFPPTFELRDLLPGMGGDGSAGFVLPGIVQGDKLHTVSAAGDINSDGVPDIVIGAFDASPNGISNAGESYVVFGRPTGFPPVFELKSLMPEEGGDGTQGFILRGEGVNDNSGIAVSAAGDINADGVDDLIIGAWNAGPAEPGVGYVVFGRMDDTP